MPLGEVVVVVFVEKRMHMVPRAAIRSRDTAGYASAGRRPCAKTEKHKGEGAQQTETRCPAASIWQAGGRTEELEERESGEEEELTSHGGNGPSIKHDALPCAREGRVLGAR
jgi:hypothetical protein